MSNRSTDTLGVLDYFVKSAQVDNYSFFEVDNWEYYRPFLRIRYLCIGKKYSKTTFHCLPMLLSRLYVSNTDFYKCKNHHPLSYESSVVFLINLSFKSWPLDFRFCRFGKTKPPLRLFSFKPIYLSNLWRRLSNRVIVHSFLSDGLFTLLN